MPCNDDSAPVCLYRPAMPIVAALALGLAIGSCRPGHTWVAGGCLIISAGLAIRAILQSRPGIAWPLLLCTALGYLSIQPWLTDTVPAEHIGRFVGDQSWRISGVVADQPRCNGNRWRFVLSAEKLRAGSRCFRVSGRLMVSGRGHWPGARRGDRVAFYGGLHGIRNFANPGGFDYTRYLALQAIRARSYAKAGTLKITDNRASGGWLAALDRYRGRISEKMDAGLHGCPQATVRLLKAILLGRRDQLSAEDRNAFSRVGVGHVLAISGLHIGMVATGTFAIAKWLLAWIPLMLRRAWTRQGAALISLGPALGYGLLAGLSPSTQRAMIMAAVFLSGFWVGRRHDWLNTLAMAALVIFFVFPPALFSVSFQLSFMAVLSILAGLAIGPYRLTAGHRTLIRRLYQWAVSLLWVSALATIGTLPLVLRYFNQVSVVGLAVNLVVVPLVGTLILPAGLAGIAATVVSTEAAVLLWRIAAIGMDAVRIIVQWVAQWPWAAVHCVTPSNIEIGLYYLLAGFFLFRTRIIRPRAVLAVLLAGCVLDAGYWYHKRFGGTQLTVTAVDVGQGTANLLQLPGGYTALIDGGGFGDNKAFDVGANILAPLLWRRKIATVDLMVLSHANSDHLNGLLFVLENFEVKQIWSNGQISGSAGSRRWKQLIAETHVPHFKVSDLPTVKDVHGVLLKILAPPGDFLQRSNFESWRDLNSNSLVLQVAYRNVSFLFAGDITAATEADLLSRLGPDALCSTVLIVPHHGSKLSSSAAFLQAVNPKEALISAGWRNRFGFPDEKVLRRLSNLGVRSWSTADKGAIQVTTDGQSYRITTERIEKPKLLAR